MIVAHGWGNFAAVKPNHPPLNRFLPMDYDQDYRYTNRPAANWFIANRRQCQSAEPQDQPQPSDSAPAAVVLTLDNEDFD